MKGIFVILIFGLALMTVQFVAFPTLKEVRQQWADIAEMQDILQRAEATKEDRAQYLDRLAEVSQEDLRKLGVLVPNRVESEDLFVFLNTIATDSGLRPKSINVTDAGGKTSTGQIQKALIFDMNVIGPYGSMRKLLDAMESNLRLMDVTVLKIGKSADANEPKSYYQLTIQGKFYYGGNQ